jgi:hypothetical protein
MRPATRLPMPWSRFCHNQDWRSPFRLTLEKPSSMWDRGGARVNGSGIAVVPRCRWAPPDLLVEHSTPVTGIHHVSRAIPRQRRYSAWGQPGNAVLSTHSRISCLIQDVLASALKLPQTLTHDGYNRSPRRTRTALPEVRRNNVGMARSRHRQLCTGY